MLREIDAAASIEAFRTVRVGEVDDPALRDSFRSHYEEGLEPRFQQTQHAALHYAVSMWRDAAVATAVARRYSKLGTFLARVVLTHGQGFNYLDPSVEPNPKHLTVWGAPDNLARAVVDIARIEL